MIRATFVVAIVTALLALAGCGGGDKKGGSSSGSSNTTSTTGGGAYPKQVEDNFLQSCTSQPGATQKYCKCALDKIEARVPFDEFKKADEALRAQKQADPKVRDAMSAAIQACKSQL